MSNINKLSTNHKTLLLAYDQGIEHGPTDFNGNTIHPNFILDLAVQAHFDGIILQKGIAEKYYKPYSDKIALVLKLNGKTKLHKGEPFSTQVCSIKEAKDLGATAVGYTVYLGSEFEPKMLSQFGKIEQQAKEYGLLVIAWMYARGKAIKDPKKPDVVAYSARVALELGADFVKINYPNSIKALAWAVESAGKTKVLVAGGNKLKDKEFIFRAKNIMSAHANGIAVGRNIWQSKNPLKIAKAIEAIVHRK